MSVIQKYIPLAIIIALILFNACDVKRSNNDADINFSRIYQDNNLSNEYHAIDIIETGDDGYLILATITVSSDSTSRDWNYHHPYVIKTDNLGEVEWTITGDDPYVSPVANLLEIDNNYYFFAIHRIDLGAHLMRINVNSESIDVASSNVYGTNAFALHAITDSDNNILFLSTSKRGTKDSYLYKISGSNFNLIWQEPVTFVNSANNGTAVIIPAVLEHLSHNGKQYAYSIKEISSEGIISAYLANCYNNTQLSLQYVSADGSQRVNSITGSRNDVFIATFQPIRDSIVSVAINDNGSISLLPEFSVTSETRMGIEDITEDMNFRELEGSSLVLSDIITSNNDKYFIYVGATKGEQVAIFVYNTTEFTIENIHYLGSMNDLKPVSVAQSTNDNSLVVLCKTLVTNRYSRIAFFKVPLSDIGL